MRCYFIVGIFFNWSIITLQCSDSFGCKTKWVSYIYTYPLLLEFPFQPLSVITEHWVALPVFTAAFRSLAILDTVVYICQCYSPFPHCFHMSVLYVWASVSSLQISSSVPFFWVPSICINIQHLFFSFWLSSLHMIYSSSTHITTNTPNFVPYYGWVIFNFIYTSYLLYPFICQWTFICLLVGAFNLLLPCSGYCK